MKLIIGMILFEEVTILDFIGPYEVFTKIKDWEIKIIGLGGKKIVCNGSLKIEAEYDISEVESVDILFVPGGYGVNEVILNPQFLKELERLATGASYITSVCTGSLVLGAANLLQGYQATSHWRSLDLLSYFGAIPNEDRVVWDGNRITGGGITSGIDFALDLVKIIEGEERAKEIELWLEYDPKPPFQMGHPRVAEKEVLERVIKNTENSRATREGVVKEFLRNKQ
ncbi:DJ-1/PfpI family protein [Leptospira sp. 'Mane']|uniref:DJ-1/PfpI family protein n=1 Tax=Leptospira sp. 'Mane' TaxID=3387407 RepID=UPI00398A5908